METSASETSTGTSPLTPTSAGKKQILVALFASVAGWSLDIFDLFLLLFVAPTIGPLFFPAENPVLSLAGVYAGFAVSGIVRPLGGVLFGSLADKRGRKKALFLTMGGVGIITALMGALPTVSQIGVLAAVLFLALRVLQGIFIGGINASTHTIGTETGTAFLAGLGGWLDSGFRRGDCDRTRIGRLRNYVKPFSRSPICDLGLALHVLYRPAERGIRFVHLLYPQ